MADMEAVSQRVNATGACLNIAGADLNTTGASLGAVLNVLLDLKDNTTAVGPPALEHDTPAYAQFLIILLYTTISLLAVGGNLIVCYIILAYKHMRTVTNFFIFNLACSDILMAVLCIPFTFVANVLMLYWPFPDLMCPVVTYVQALSVFLSAFTLVAISLDRYRAIMFPLRPRMTRTQAVLVIVGIWSLSLLVPLPIALLSRPITLDNSTNTTSCQEVWPSGRARYIYSMLLMVLQYFLPLFVLTFTYSSIGVVIWSKRLPGEAERCRDKRMAASKRKMVKMMIIVVIIYALCWLPLHTITLVGDSHPGLYDYPYIQVVWTACHWLAMSNSCYNPLVYCWMNARFRAGFVYVLRFCPCVAYQASEHSPERFPRRSTYVTTLRSNHDTRASRTDTSPYANRRAHSNYSAKENVPLEKLENGLSNGRKSHSSRTGIAQNGHREDGRTLGKPSNSLDDNV